MRQTFHALGAEASADQGTQGLSGCTVMHSVIQNRERYMHVQSTGSNSMYKLCLNDCNTKLQLVAVCRKVYEITKVLHKLVHFLIIDKNLCTYTSFSPCANVLCYILSTS